jgi:hypothetical protein
MLGSQNTNRLLIIRDSKKIKKSPFKKYMMKKIFWTIGALSIIAVIVINMSLAKLNVASNFSLTQIEAAGGSFEFNGQNWDTNSHWYNVAGGEWKPVLIYCNGSSNTGGSIGFGTGYITVTITINGTTTTWNGQQVQCQGGNGNCANGTSCMGIPAS